MKTERAIELLRRLQDEQFDGQHGDERREALSMAVRALFSQQIVNDSQGLVNDCISRKMAIDALKSQLSDWNDDYNIPVRKSIENIERLPSAQPEQRWIPCSERLPEIKEHHVSDTVICYCSNGAYAFSQLQENIFGQCSFECERDDDYYEAVGDVIAWMPLPKPYGGKNDG